MDSTGMLGFHNSVLTVMMRLNNSAFRHKLIWEDKINAIKIAIAGIVLFGAIMVNNCNQSTPPSLHLVEG